MKQVRVSKRPTPWKKLLASEMRSNMTWPEKKLWSKLRNKQLGVTFFTQKVILGYIADFWCPKAQLVVETDGKYHLKKKQQAWDNTRDKAMAAQGIKTMRFTAQEVFNNLPAVVAMIQAEVDRRIPKEEVQ